MNKRVSKALGEKFTFTLKNNTGVTKTVAILAAFFNTLKVVSAADGSPAAISETNAAAITAAGFPCDYVLDDGTIATDLIASSANSKMSIRAFKEYIKQGGRMLVDMSVRANNAAAFEKTMEVVKCSPLKGSAPHTLFAYLFRFCFHLKLEISIPPETEKPSVNTKGFCLCRDDRIYLTLNPKRERCSKEKSTHFVRHAFLFLTLYNQRIDYHIKNKKPLQNIEEAFLLSG